MQYHIVAGHGDKDKRSKNDFYPTPPPVTAVLLERERFPGPVLEPCAGAGHIVGVLEKYKYEVIHNELYPHDNFIPNTSLDFTQADNESFPPFKSIVTNPPYSLAQSFIEKAIELGTEKHAWLLRFQFIESVGRYHFFKKFPPKRIWVFSKRVQVSEGGLENPNGGVMVFAWWIWEKGFKGAPSIYWIEPNAIDEVINPPGLKLDDFINIL